MNSSVKASQAVGDPVSNVLKWVLLGVALLTFALMAWATFLTYRTQMAPC